MWRCLSKQSKIILEKYLWIIQPIFTILNFQFVLQYTLSKIEKGDYILKMQVRHEKRELLERLTEMPILLTQKLSSQITLDVYASQSQAIIGGKKMVAASIPPGHILPLYIAPLTNESKWVICTYMHYLNVLLKIMSKKFINHCSLMFTNTFCLYISFVFSKSFYHTMSQIFFRSLKQRRNISSNVFPHIL